ncbi:MAG: FesM [Acidobacteria bacterium]|nr:FesM [Acidobacteriota bacterium]
MHLRLPAAPVRGLSPLAAPGVVERFLRWRHARTAMQVPLFAVAVAMVVHGFLGPQLAPRNLATLLTWVHYRGALVLVLLAAGNLFCMACPFMLPRTLARRFFKPTLRWPRRLRSKWLALGLFVLILYAYELFDLWSSPWWTAWLIVAYFATALVVDSVFKDASFCKWVCPLGQFNFVASTVSPLEVRVRDADACLTCTTHDCIKGTRDPVDPAVVLQQGCELGLFLPKKTGNMDCTFCLDCVHACPHDNVVLATRVPASELWVDPRRSGVGLFSRRKDLAALAIVFAFGALVNAFGMVSPVYAVEEWLAHRLGTTHEAPVLGTLFLLLLVVEPVLLLGLAAWLTRRGAGTREPLVPVTNRFAYAFIPLGFGIWLAHYTFHFVTGLWTFVPVTQEALAAIGVPWLGSPNWRLTGLSPGLVHPLELGFLSLGLLGSLLVAHRIAERDYPLRAARAFAPWAGLFLLLAAAAIWLLYQPMEMRGTMLGS